MSPASDRPMRKRFRNSALRALRLEAGIHLLHVSLEDLLLAGPAHPVDRIDVAFGVVVVEAGLGVHALHRTDHLGGEKYVVGWDHFQEQVDTRLMIDAGVEEDVVHDELFQRRALHVLSEAAVAAPVIESGEHTSELQSLTNLVCRLLLVKKKQDKQRTRRRATALST